MKNIISGLLALACVLISVYAFYQRDRAVREATMASRLQMEAHQLREHMHKVVEEHKELSRQRAEIMDDLSRQLAIRCK